MHGRPPHGPQRQIRVFHGASEVKQKTATLFRASATDTARHREHTSTTHRILAIPRHDEVNNKKSLRTHETVVTSDRNYTQLHLVVMEQGMQGTSPPSSSFRGDPIFDVTEN